MINEEGGDSGQGIAGSLIAVEDAPSLDSAYELGKTIGRGEFAKVKVARCRKSKRLVAIKIVPIDYEHEAKRGERLYREISILSRLNHPNIIKLMRVIRLPDRLAMVMEYARGGELFDHVQSKGHLPECMVRIIMCQIFRAVEYMHSQHIVHRDLKLENILRDEHGQVCLTDFGFAQSFADESKLLETACGSPCYAAPELVLDRTGYRAPPADIWSCGVIMYAMCYGYLPFESDLPLDRRETDPIVWTPANVYALYQHIATHPVQLPRMPGGGLSGDGEDLLRKLLQPEPSLRIGMEDIWRHPWLALAPK